MLALFVYGTLMPERENHHYLASIQGSWQKASVRGKLFPDGVGLAKGYPALILNKHEQVVDGWLLSSDELTHHWQRLDEFEGIAYERVNTTVRTEKENISAYVYVLSME
jgi:gamma-glutamylcyclotransferase (GGCT)/AIG2-like uncharacterized protein YtfP